VKKLKYDSICALERKKNASGYPHVLPIHASSAFSYSSIEDSIKVFEGREKGYVYSRYGNPTVTEVEEKLAMLESAEMNKEVYALMTSSGMSAISTLLVSQLREGDALLSQYSLYGGTTELLNKILAPRGVDIIYCNMGNAAEVVSTLTANRNVKLIYFESPTNPTLECIDIEGIVKLASDHGIKTAIDNTFSTSYLQKPLALGVDFAVYSTTKFLNGHGNSIAGAIICLNEADRKSIWDVMKLMGTNCNPFDAWLLHNGLKTLALRMDRHCANAAALAEFLAGHDHVVSVNYPGLQSHAGHKIAKKQMKDYGAMLSFELNGNIKNAMSFMNACRLCSITSTLGNVDTLLLHPASSSHLNVDEHTRQKSGITDGLIRVSVGIENIQDIIEDIDQAINLAFEQ